MKLNVGCGKNILDGWTNLDSVPGMNVDVVRDLEGCRKDTIPFPDDTVEEFLLSHVIEHVRDTLGLMQELHRIAKPGAHMAIRTPHGSSDDAWEDPTHVRPYFINSFGYFSQPFYWRADYGYRGDWQTKRVTLLIDPDVHATIPNSQLWPRIHSSRNMVIEMIAELEAVKPIREQKQELQEQVQVVLAPFEKYGPPPTGPTCYCGLPNGVMTCAFPTCGGRANKTPTPPQSPAD